MSLAATPVLNPDSRLFTLARQGKRQPSALEGIVVVLFLLGSIIAFQSTVRNMLPSIFPDATEVTREMAENTLGFLPVYLGLWAWLRWSMQRPFASLGLEGRRASRGLLGGALAGALMIAVTAGLAVLPGASFGPGEWQTAGFGALGIGLLSLLSFLVQSSAEEVLFRGWLLQAIGSRYSPWLGVCVSSMIFSLAHSLNPALTSLAALNLFLFGLFTSAYAITKDGIWEVCAWHAVWNWAQGDVLGLPLGGGAHKGLLIAILPTGPDVITGGAYGPEGGLTATAVLLLAIAVIAWQSRRQVLTFG